MSSPALASSKARPSSCSDLAPCGFRGWFSNIVSRRGSGLQVRSHRSPRVLIPPRKGALLASGPASSRQRNRNIAAQARLGKRKWHTESGYSKRSKVETTFHRYKAIVGSAMRARGLAAQRGEARIGCKILNIMTALGMPDSEMIG